MLASDEHSAPLLELFHRGTHLAYKKGEFIIRPGESPPGIFYIEKGIVKAYDITKYGEENLLIVRHQKEVFPLIWALTGKERQVIYEALSDTTVWRIDRNDFLKLIKDNPELLAALLDMTVELYRIHSERIINLEYRTVRERLISFLLTMSQRFGKQTRHGLEITVPLKQQDIASSINSTRETTSRELTLLEKKGLITNNGMIVLLDTKALREFL